MFDGGQLFFDIQDFQNPKVNKISFIKPHTKLTGEFFLKKSK